MYTEDDNVEVRSLFTFCTYCCTYLLFVLFTVCVIFYLLTPLAKFMIRTLMYTYLMLCCLVRTLIKYLHIRISKWVITYHGIHNCGMCCFDELRKKRLWRDVVTMCDAKRWMLQRIVKHWFYKCMDVQARTLT